MSIYIPIAFIVIIVLVVAVFDPSVPFYPVPAR